MSNVSQFFGGIKGIQRGTIVLAAGGTLTNTATITSVDTTKTELRLLGTLTGGTSATDNQAYITLTNATTITASRNTGVQALTVSWETTEFY